MKLKDKIELILEMFDKTCMTYLEISEKVGLSKTSVHRYVNKNRSKEQIKERWYKNKSKAVTGSSHPNYKTGRSVQGRYVTVVKPEWYTGRKNCTRVYEHHVVYCEHNNMTEIPKGMCIHHIDHNKLNNSISNLELMTLGEHTKIHNINRGATTIRKEYTQVGGSARHST